MQIRLSDRHIAALNFALIAAIAYFAALSVDDLIARSLTAGSGFEAPARAARRANAASLSRASYSVIVERDVFNSVKAAPAPAAPVATNLHVKLLGTSELTAAKPFAIIEDTNNHQQALYRLGDEVLDAGTLVGVEKKRVLLNHEGQVMSLAIADDLPAASAPSSAPGVPVPDQDQDEQPTAQENDPPPVPPSRPSPWKKLDPNQPPPWNNSLGASRHGLRNRLAGRAWSSNLRPKIQPSFPGLHGSDGDD
jgi:type II secretory pathway component PulC